MAAKILTTAAAGGVALVGRAVDRDLADISVGRDEGEKSERGKRESSGGLHIREIG